MSNDLINDSKYLSYLLRHHPEEVGCEIDKYGWVDVSTLIKNSKLNLERLSLIVSSDTRYEFSEDRSKIRAFHGHSVKGVEPYIKIIPPDVVYHGTSKNGYKGIIESGLIKSMSRNYVHLSLSFEKAKEVGNRHGDPIVLIIDSKKMYEDGYEFFDSNDNVILTKEVPIRYIEAQ